MGNFLSKNWNLMNLKKTFYYWKRNGVKGTWSAVRERLDKKRQQPYEYVPPAGEELERQKALSKKSETGNNCFSDIRFSIVVPVYRTPETYLRDMVFSVKNQTYGNWELILADATEDDSLEAVLKKLLAEAAEKDGRIRYFHLSSNDGIAQNTNQGLLQASGDYVGLLDHDDMLTEDALFEMAAAIAENRKKGIETQWLYSDEDKCNGEGTAFYDPNKKEDFNLDLLLSNNYICHFMVMKRELIQQLKLRGEYNGAQDFDLVLRAAALLEKQPETIVHIPKVLYHWRCHTGSTAENPQSKLYAYEAGRRAVQDFAADKNWQVEVTDTRHLGFYRMKYLQSPLKVREDVAAVGGRLLKKGKVAGGRMDLQGNCFYLGLPASYSGYLHRAVLQQDAEVLDIRSIEVRKELRPLFEAVTGVPYTVLPGTEIFDAVVLPEGTDYKALSIAVCRELTRESGKRLLYLPEREKRIS